MKKIWFDIGHPAQLNFYINSIKELSKYNKVLVTVIDRGRLLKISRKELGSINNCKIIPLGRHKGNKFSAILDANIIRIIKLFGYYFRYKPEISVGNGFLHGIIGKTFKFPSLMFNDDIERKIIRFLMNKFSTEVYYVVGSRDDDSDKIKTFNALKEWAYLSPSYFVPKKEVLAMNNVKEDEYIFVREVSTGTLNYQSQVNNLIATISSKFPKGIAVLLSLEDKSTIQLYPKDWVLLQEPIKNFHSLIYYSKILISSGDSMAREASMLGVPSIYCGNREMRANNIMINKGRLFWLSVEETIVHINKIMTGELKLEKKEVFRNRLNKEWVDATQFIIEKINNLK